MDIYRFREDCGKILYRNVKKPVSYTHLDVYKRQGPDTDVPAGDIGTGAREIGYMYGQYKRIRNAFEGVLTGKGLTYGGSLARTEATGYGLLYFTAAMLKKNGYDMAGKTVVISGAGNVAIYACQKAQEMGAKVVTMSGSTGWVYDPEGIDLAAIKEIKEVKRARLTEYKNYRPNSEYHEGRGVWSVKCDIALPCATRCVSETGPKARNGWPTGCGRCPRCRAALSRPEGCHPARLSAPWTSPRGRRCRCTPPRPRSHSPGTPISASR